MELIDGNASKYHNNINQNIVMNINDVHDNIFNMISSKYHNEDIIWFRNNGLTWHTLHKFKGNFYELQINGKLYMLNLPEMIIHIEKNYDSKYTIDVYFKNRFCGSDDLIESFLKIDDVDFHVPCDGYLNESSFLINYIFTQHNFTYAKIKDYVKNSKSNFINYMDGLSIIDVKLSDMIEDWKKDVNRIDSFHLFNKAFVKTPIYKNNDTVEYYHILGLTFERMNLIKFGGKEYLIYAIHCDKLFKDSIANNFINDKIVLYDIENNTKKLLPIERVLDMKVKKYMIDDIKQIENTNIKIGNYILNKKPFKKITKITFDQNTYEFKIDSNMNDSNMDHISLHHSLFDINSELRISSLSDFLKIDDEWKFPFFNIYNKTIISYTDSNDQHSIDDLIEIRRGFEFKHIKSDEIFNISDYVMTAMLKNIKSDKKINTELPTYIYDYIPKQKDDNSTVNPKQLFEVNDKIYIDTINDFTHIKVDNEDSEIPNICDYIKDNIEMPCILNGMIFDQSVKYISHFNQEKEIFSIHEMTLSDGIKLELKNENGDIKIIYLDHHGKIDCLDLIIDPFDGLEIGQWGKLTNLKAVYGFKKSLYYQIVNFYKSGGYDMVLFNNGIAVKRDLVKSETFKKPLRKNITNLNVISLSNDDVRRIFNSAKYLKKFIKEINFQDEYYNNRIMKIEITSI